MINNDSISSSQPFRSKSTLFFERYSRAESQNVQMRLLVYLLSGLLLILLCAFVFSVARPRAVYYVPGAVSSGIAHPGQVPLSSVKSFAVSWLMGWMNYTPETVEGVYERSKLFMGASLLSQVHSRSAEELEKVRRDRLSSVFMLSSEPKISEDKGEFKVTLEGKRGIYMGKEEMSFEAIRYVMSIVKTASTEQNPYALAVSHMRKEGVEYAHE